MLWGKYLKASFVCCMTIIACILAVFGIAGITFITIYAIELGPVSEALIAGAIATIAGIVGYTAGKRSNNNKNKYNGNLFGSTD